MKKDKNTDEIKDNIPKRKSPNNTNPHLSYLLMEFNKQIV